MAICNKKLKEGLGYPKLYEFYYIELYECVLHGCVEFHIKGILVGQITPTMEN